MPGTTAASEKRQSQYKRKPPPSTAMLVDLELGDASTDRYPPFDLDDPFASLTDLRRRSRSLSCMTQTNNGANNDLHHQTTGDLAPFDLPQLSPKAFPSEIRRRYTLTVALPSPLSLSAADSSPADAHCNKEAQRGDALAKLTARKTWGGRKGVDSDRFSSRSKAKDAADFGQTSSHQDHHRPYTRISMLFRSRAASSAHLPQNQNGSAAGTPKSHYMPRKASSLSCMYTPPLTPDVSGTSSSSSLFDPAMALAHKVEEDAIPPPSKSPTPSTHSFVKKLLTKRSAGILPPLPRRKASLDAKDLPSPPPSPTPKEKPEGGNAVGVPLPCSPGQASMSDVTLPTTLYSEKQKTTVSIIGASPQPSIIFSRLSPPERREVDGYVTAPEVRLPPGADLDAGLVPPRKTKLFTFTSRSLLRSRVDLYETVDEMGRTTSNLLEGVAARMEFDEYALPTPTQLSTAASLSVISESGVRIRFGDIWEKQKTVIIFIRHFRAIACQDYVRSISSELDVEALEKAGLKIVIVGMGSASLITPYRQLTGTTFPVYTDPTLAVHRALGMTLRSSDRGSASEQGHYIASRGGTFGSLRRTISGVTRLPLFERAGDTAQLGGEFILGPGPNSCTFAHRMRTTRAHTPILDVVAASGVQTSSARSTRHMRGVQKRIGRAMKSEGAYPDGNEGGRSSMEDEDAWMARRRRSLVRLRKKRQRRRAGIGARGSAKDSYESVSVSDSGLDTDEGTPTSTTTHTSEHVVTDSNSNLRRNLTGRFSVVEEEEDEFEDIVEGDDSTAFDVR